MLLEKCSDDLRRQFETMSDTRMNEYMLEKGKLEARIAEMVTNLDELKRQLDSEVEKSNEKSAELIALNKQKFKLMAQVFIGFCKKSQCLLNKINQKNYYRSNRYKNKTTS